MRHTMSVLTRSARRFPSSRRERSPIRSPMVMLVFLASLALSGCIRHSPGDEDSADSGPTVPPVEDLVDGGWQDSNVPWQPPILPHQMWALHVWSRPGAVYFGYHYTPMDLPQDQSPIEIAVNRGQGWSVFLDLDLLGFDMSAGIGLTALRGIPDQDVLFLGGTRTDADPPTIPESGIFQADATGIDFQHGVGEVQHLFVVDESMAYATDGNLVTRYDRGLWEPLPLQVPYPVVRLWASSTALFGVGHAGNIVSYEVDHWQTHASGTLEALRGIWGFADDDLWVMDIWGSLLHFDGLAWSAVPWPDSPAGPPICAQDASDFSGLFGVGGVLFLYGKTFFARYDTLATTPAFELLADWRCQDPACGCTDELRLFDLWGNAPDEVFLAVGNSNLEIREDGRYNLGDSAFLLYFDGDRFHWF